MTDDSKNKTDLQDLEKYIEQQTVWSLETFGPGERDAGIIDHIIKELAEIGAAPGDIMEWVDVVILALDGAWRNGHTPHDICKALMEKQQINFNRKWPDWRQYTNGEAIEHIKN